MSTKLPYKLGCFVNAKILRDAYKRETFKDHEITRQALRYIARNMTLPARQRAEAQLRLTQLPVSSQPTKIKNRCIMGGKGRGVLRAFKMARYPFRIAALDGQLPGVRVASW